MKNLPPSLVPPDRRRGVSTVAHESLTRAVLLDLEVGGALPRSIVLEISRHRWTFAQIPGVL